MTQKISHYFFALLLTVSSAQASPPQIQLANIYHQDVDIKNYLVSEKLDGVRAYFDGEKFISRQGNIINAPKWFSKNFPKEVLDGELWISRSSFELVSSIVRQQIPSDSDWQKIHFMIFDLPKSSEIFERRFEMMKKLAAQTNSKHLQVIDQFRVESHQALMQKLKSVVENGAEGLMLHRADSPYKSERNDDLLKLKTFEDEEAIVIAHIAGSGKYQKMLGALLVENSDKIQFKIGSGFSDLQRQNPPKIGSKITYKFFGKTKNNVPRFAVFMRVRDEI
jgi:DNA ligase-1